MSTRRDSNTGVLVGLLIIISAATTARAGLDSTAGYAMNYYSDVEGVSVTTHYLDYGVVAPADMRFSVHWVHDVVVIPALDAPPGSQEAIDAITTASRPIASEAQAYEDYVKKRNSIQGGLAFRDASVSYYVSHEIDYFAQMVTASYSHDFLNQNLTVVAGVSYSWDLIQPLVDADTEGLADDRRTLHGNLVLTQVLTPTTVLRLGTEVNNVNGQQHDPYRNVYAGGINVAELHPRTRLRRDYFALLSQYLGNRSSIKADYRYYTDDWGVLSQTYGLRLSQYVSDAVIVRYRYRYYNQEAAFFFADSYAESEGIRGYRTGDYRLGDFGAHLFGGQIAWRPRRAPLVGGVLKGPQLILSYERYFNSNNFTATIYEMGVHLSF